MKTKHITDCFILFLFTFAAAGLSGCNQHSAIVENYTEIFMDIPKEQTMSSMDPHAFLNQMPDDEIHSKLKFENNDIPNSMLKSVAQTSLIWKAPTEWNESAGNGMRLATFNAKDKSNPIETTIVSLAGQAGGLEANVSRWLGQLKITADSPEKIDQFIKSQKKIKLSNGSEITVLDFTQWKNSSDNDPSMMAAVLNTEDAQIFIKMTGSVKSIQKNKSAFESLIQSLNFKSAP